MIYAALIAGNLLTCTLALRAADTNPPPPAPRVGAPPQGQRPQGMMGGPSVDQLAQQLNLSDDQKAKVKPILDGERQKVIEARGDTSLSREDRQAKMQGIREATATQMKAVLTAEQFGQWEKLRTQRIRRPGPGGPPPGGEKAGSTNAPAAPSKN